MSGRILVVDDEYDLLQAIRGVLEDEGFDVAACSSGPEAIAFVEREIPSVVLLDVMMPYMTGYDVLDRVRRMPGCEALAVIMMSAVEPAPELRRRAPFLRKPFDFDRLVSTVRGLLDGQSPVGTQSTAKPTKSDGAGTDQERHGGVSLAAKPS